jgi:hypothetical protein
MSVLSPIGFLTKSVEELSQRVFSAFEDLRIAIRALTFKENFQSWETTITIAAGVEAQIKNGFRDGTIPTRYLKVSETGPGVITKGPTAWSKDYVFLINNASTSSGTVTVVFLK